MQYISDTHWKFFSNLILFGCEQLALACLNVYDLIPTIKIFGLQL